MNPRLEEFFRRCNSTVYEEKPSHLHTSLTDQMAQDFATKLAPGATILDVGCGQGPALDWFCKAGFSPVGITIGISDIEACAKIGRTVLLMDQNELTFSASEFDAVWARHVVEHSPIPFFTLCEFWRVLKPGGWLYLEIPAPGTDAGHETNKNHFSVLGEKMWSSLLARAGFRGFEKFNQIGPFPIGEKGEATDRYFAFTVQKPNL